MPDEEGTVHGRTDHRGFCGSSDVRSVSQARISSETYYKWQAKNGGLDLPEAKRLRSLEDVNRWLKKLMAETMLDVAMMKDIASEKW